MNHPFSSTSPTVLPSKPFLAPSHLFQLIPRLTSKDLKLCAVTGAFAGQSVTVGRIATELGLTPTATVLRGLQRRLRQLSLCHVGWHYENDVVVDDADVLDAGLVDFDLLILPSLLHGLHSSDGEHYYYDGLKEIERWILLLLINAEFRWNLNQTMQVLGVLPREVRLVDFFKHLDCPMARITRHQHLLRAAVTKLKYHNYITVSGSGDEKGIFVSAAYADKYVRPWLNDPKEAYRLHSCGKYSRIYRSLGNMNFSSPLPM